MIKFITNGKYRPSNKYQRATLEELIEYIKPKESLSLDVETNGLHPHDNKLLSVQVGDKDTQFVIDCLTVDIYPLKPYLESKELIGHNIKFDLQFLFKENIWPHRVYDTFIAERVLYCGLKSHRASLQHLCESYLGVRLDKSVRASIGLEGLTERVIVYGAKDIQLLEDIREKQEELLKDKNLEKVNDLEKSFIPALAYIEFCGFKLSKERWLAKMEKDKLLHDQALDKLNQYVLDNGPEEFIDPQLSLFEEGVSCKINWSSPSQVIPYFEHLGIDCTVNIKGQVKKSVEAPVLEKYRKDFEVIDLYLTWRGYNKIITTYGESFLKQISPTTGRIHTSFKQIKDTGRLSSGGSKADGSAYINFQNIPSDEQTRSSFVAEEGNVLIVADYSGQEQIVLANRCLDPNILEFYDKGLGDMHSFIASKIYPELGDLSLKEIKKNHSQKRQHAKAAGFAINYGGAGSTIASNLGLSKEEGESIYQAYFEAFPGLKDYFDKSKKQGLEDGYILISNITHRKSYIYFYDEYLYYKSMVDNKDFWNKYREHKEKETPEFPELKERVGKYFRMKGNIERLSLNYPIQGSSAEITKISCIYIFSYILKNKLQNIVKMCNTVHDENVLECPEYMAEEIKDMVKKAMEKAGAFYCQRVPLKADPIITPVWKK